MMLQDMVRMDEYGIHVNVMFIMVVIETIVLMIALFALIRARIALTKSKSEIKNVHPLSLLDEFEGTYRGDMFQELRDIEKMKESDKTKIEKMKSTISSFVYRKGYNMIPYQLFYKIHQDLLCRDKSLGDEWSRCCSPVV